MSNAILAAEVLPLGETDRDAFSLATRLFTKRVVRDRFGVLNHSSPYKLSEVCEAVPTPLVGMAFSDIMDTVACEFLENYERIAIAWSGGLDSTAIVTAFLRNLSDYGRLSVYCTESSITEAPEFYKLLNALGVHIVLDNRLLKTIGTAECDIIVNGCGADSFFGSIALRKAPRLYYSPVHDGIREMWYVSNPISSIGKKSVNDIVELLDSYSKHLGLNVKYFCDIAWLFEFGCRITHGSEQLRMLLGGYPNSNKCESFFKHQLFSRWAIGNYEKARSVNPYLTPTHYKAELRQYIYSYDKNENYYLSKGKMNSLLGVDCDLGFVNILTLDGVLHYKMPVGGEWLTFANNIVKQFRKDTLK